MHLEGKEHLRPVQQYAESYGVGRGTVQGAIQELMDCGAIALNACGARGTFLERVEQAQAVLTACGYGEQICLMPLNINMDYRGLATGIYEAISAKDLPIHILFARGSRNRVKMLLRQKCDFVAMSQLACEAAIERRGLTIEAAQTLGDYPQIWESSPAAAWNTRRGGRRWLSTPIPTTSAPCTRFWACARRSARTA